MYSLKFCYFVVMGGFQVSIKDVYPGRGTRESYIEGPPTILPLSPQGITQLAKLGHFLTLSEKKIDDRSKANIIQKVLVITQVGWMAVQCAVRAAWGLPISLLELHVLVHVVIACMLYGFWFKVSRALLYPQP